MKKNLPAAAIAISLLLAASCKKKENVDETNSWTFNAQAHTASSVVVAEGDRYIKASAGSNSITFMFKALPQGKGSFKVAAKADVGNKVAIIAHSNGRDYTSYDNTGSEAKIVISMDKISVLLPETWVKSLNPGTGMIDSVKVTASIVETSRIE
jgi:hypothetical protein